MGAAIHHKAPMKSPPTTNALERTVKETVGASALFGKFLELVADVPILSPTIARPMRTVPCSEVHREQHHSKTQR